MRNIEMKTISSLFNKEIFFVEQQRKAKESFTCFSRWEEANLLHFRTWTGHISRGRCSESLSLLLHHWSYNRLQLWSLAWRPIRVIGNVYNGNIHCRLTGAACLVSLSSRWDFAGLLQHFINRIEIIWLWIGGVGNEWKFFFMLMKTWQMFAWGYQKHVLCCDKKAPWKPS